MFASGGNLVRKTPDITVWQGNVKDWPTSLELNGRFVAYGELYRKQLWVGTLVDKRANAVARLPLKPYRRSADGGRNAASDSPYGTLVLDPARGTCDPFTFWQWVQSTFDIYGEAILGKIRDSGGRPYQLVRLHPTNVHNETRDGKEVWWYDDGKTVIKDIDRRDLVIFKTYNPRTTLRGLSKLEQLRDTLENEAGARAANSALWRNGGRPSVAIRHPKTLSDVAFGRLTAQWSELHGGVENWAKAAILEEGMEAQILQLNVEELQYIEARKLNREEVCARYDMPPPVVHILDRATYSNITEQMRSLYRDTMAPICGNLESTLETELRDGRMGGAGEPDFGSDYYAEFLMDEVLRGDFEQRAKAYQEAINSGWMTPAEVRSLENLPFISGTDQLLVNSTMKPYADAVETTGRDMSTAEALQKITAAVTANVITAEEARAIVNEMTGSTLATAAPPQGARRAAATPTLTLEQVRSVMGRLGQTQHPAHINTTNLTAGLPPAAAKAVTDLVVGAVTCGSDLAGIKAAIKTLGMDPPDGTPAALPPAPAAPAAPAAAAQVPPIYVSVDARQEPPTVHITNQVAAPEPATVHVTVERQGGTTKTVERDPAGNITRIVEG